MADTIIKKWNGSTFDEVYPRTTHTQIVATGTPSSTTFLRGDGTWAVPSGVDNYVNITGDTMTGNLINQGYIQVQDPTDSDYVRYNHYGLEFNRNSSYLRPTTNGTYTLYVGFTAANNAWDTIVLDADNKTIIPTGNVGIGTTSPSQKLDVVGNIAVSGTVDGVDIAALDTSVVKLSGTQTITGYKTLDAGMGIGNSSGTTSDSIIFNTAQTYTGPSIRGRGQTLYRDYYLSNYEIADAGNYADVIPGSWTEIKSTENTITSGTATTSVTVSGSLASDDIIAIEFHTVDTEGTYSTSIQFVKLGSASSSLYSVVMFPSYNSGTTMRISFARVWLASSTSVSFSYSYYGEIDTTPGAQVDTVVVGKIWKINGVTGV